MKRSLPHGPLEKDVLCSAVILKRAPTGACLCASLSSNERLFSTQRRCMQAGADRLSATGVYG